MSQNQCPDDFSSHGTIVVDTLAQVLVGRVIGEPSELVLNGLGEVRVLDDGVLSHLAREFRIEVGNVQHGFLETRMYNIGTSARPRGSIDLRHWV
jgi:hypothetical protein